MEHEVLIQYYNRLNGKSISIETLKGFRERVQTALDSNGHGTYTIDLKGILSRVTKAIKDLISESADIADRIDLVPIEIKKHDGKILRVASGYEEKKTVVKADNLVAEEIVISKVHTDTKRFQNRMDAFSEASANSVAENYDPNKFDPIVVWEDSKAKKIFVLSGHSRYEGMKRRGAKTIAVRYFKGTEEQAIKFAKVEANRAANQESLIEDLAAYRLMRDGDESKGIKKLSKTELGKIFKGKVQKLEAYSFLASGGLFVNALNQGTTSNYPYLERNAQWIGQLRKENTVISNAGEDNIFHFFYSDKSGRNLKLSKDEFFKLANKKVAQLGRGEGVLFPECSSEGCLKVADKESDPIKGETFKRLREISEQIGSIREKLSSRDPKVRVTTEEEKKYLRETAQRLETEKDKIQRDLEVMDKSQANLFGIKKSKKVKTKFKHRKRGKMNGPQIDAFEVKQVAKQKGPLNRLQMQQLQDAIKAGRTPKVNLKAKMNAKKTEAPLFEPSVDPKQASLFGTKKSKPSLSGVTYQYYAHNLGPFKKELVRVNSDATMMFWGLPGHGKTVKMLLLAQHFADQGKKTLYISDEEYGKSTFDEKINQFKIGSPNLTTTGEFTESGLAKHEIIFFDSVNTLKLTASDIKSLHKKFPNRLFILIVQTTKEGDFKGGQEWEHLVDIAGPIINRKIILRKNRFDPENNAKAEKLMETEMISEQLKKKQIREAVKAKTEQPTPSNKEVVTL